MNILLWLFCTLLLLVTAAISVDAVKLYDTIEDQPCFRSMQGILDSMCDLVKDHSNLVSITNIGESYLRTNQGHNYGKYDIPTGSYNGFMSSQQLPPASGGGGSRWLLINPL